MLLSEKESFATTAVRCIHENLSSSNAKRILEIHLMFYRIENYFFWILDGKDLHFVARQLLLIVEGNNIFDEFQSKP